MKLDSNLVVIVTGGASGLGKGTCILLAQYHCKIVIADNNEVLGKSLLKTLKTEAIFVQFDVSSEDSIINLIKTTIKVFGKINVLINSAGIHSILPTITQQGIVASTAEYHKVFNINVLGTFNMAKHCACQMKNQPYINEIFKEKGLIINVSSIQGHEGQKSRVIYAASKGAILGMTLPMARDLGRYGIRVCCISPGAFMTPLQGDITKETIKSVEKQIPLGRFGKSEEFAEIVVFMIENSYMTGVDFRVDGGLRLKL